MQVLWQHKFVKALGLGPVVAECEPQWDFLRLSVMLWGSVIPSFLSFSFSDCVFLLVKLIAFYDGLGVIPWVLLLDAVFVKLRGLEFVSFDQTPQGVMRYDSYLQITWNVWQTGKPIYGSANLNIIDHKLFDILWIPHFNWFRSFSDLAPEACRYLSSIFGLWWSLWTTGRAGGGVQVEVRMGERGNDEWWLQHGQIRSWEV